MGSESGPRVLAVSPRDLGAELGGTILWRAGIVRRQVADHTLALEEARGFRPNLVLIDGAEEDSARALIASLRGCEATRSTAIVVMSRGLGHGAERALGAAGANQVLSSPVDDEIWGPRLESLLMAPPRCETRTPVRAALWTQEIGRESAEFAGTALDLSAGGMRIETGQRLLPGAKLDVRFRLPGQPDELRSVAQVIWSDERGPGRVLAGIQFLVHRDQARSRIEACVASALSSTPGGAPSRPEAGASVESAEWEWELRASEARKLAILDTSPEAIVSVDARGAIVEFNTAAELLFGYQRGEVLGKDCAELLVPPGLRDALQAVYRRLLGDRAGLFRTRRFTSSAVRRDGREFPAEVVLRPMMVHGRLLFTAFLRDLTEVRRIEQERQRLEAQLLQAQKLEAIGALASGVAHEFNNVLTTVVGHGELALDHLPEDHPARESVRQILVAADHARAIVRQILAFGRRDLVDPRPLDIAAAVADAVALVEKTFPSSIRVRAAIDAKTGTVVADPAQVLQIVLNLCTNARHAIPEERGEIRVSLRRVGGPEAGECGRALLSVEDSGRGMEPEVLSRIFEPFFTTKESGKGTGLGLAVVQGIVGRLGGSITAESVPGSGSTFSISLPLAAREAPAAATPPASATCAGERILFVDDDPVIAGVARHLLEQSGCQVTAVTSSAEALALLRESPSGFDLLITDLEMPNLSGLELLAQVRALRPSLPVIICTGLADSWDAQRAAQLGIGAPLAKPFRRAELLARIRDLFPRTPG